LNDHNEVNAKPAASLSAKQYYSRLLALLSTVNPTIRNRSDYSNMDHTPGPHIKGMKVGRGFKRNSNGGIKRKRRERIGKGGATGREGRE
jgi:hypothetical protein